MDRKQFTVGRAVIASAARLAFQRGLEALVPSSGYLRIEAGVELDGTDRRRSEAWLEATTNPPLRQSEAPPADHGQRGPAPLSHKRRR